MGNDFREADIFGCSEDGRVVLQNDAVLDNGDAGGNAVGSVFLENRGGVDDVVYIPFARFTHGVCQWRCLFVDTAGLAVHVCFVVVAVEYLNFVHPLHEDAAVAASLAGSGDVFRNAPFDM